MKTISKQTINKKIRVLINKSESDLYKAVAEDILDNDSPADYIHDVLTHGCQSGVVSMLVYYNDTHSFYKKYADEIMELFQTLEDDCGHIEVKGDGLNFLAWLGYEETARRIANDLGIEI